MNIRKTILLIGSGICIITFSFGYVIIADKSLKTSVKGVSISISPTPTVTPSPTLLPTLAPTSTDKPLLTKIQPMPQTKQYGGSYWQAELGKAQVWIGTDSAKKDIFVDRLPTPTLTSTPAPKPATQQSVPASSIGEFSPTPTLIISGTSSIETVYESSSVKIGSVKIEVSAKK